MPQGNLQINPASYCWSLGPPFFNKTVNISFSSGGKDPTKPITKHYYTPPALKLVFKGRSVQARKSTALPPKIGLVIKKGALGHYEVIEVNESVKIKLVWNVAVFPETKPSIHLAARFPD
jgi:hypothetical protein